MTQIPHDLLAFMETLKPPKGVNPADLLIKYNDLVRPEAAQLNSL